MFVARYFKQCLHDKLSAMILDKLDFLRKRNNNRKDSEDKNSRISSQNKLRTSELIKNETFSKKR